MKKWFGREDEQKCFRNALDHWCSDRIELILLTTPKALVKVDVIQALWNGYQISEG
jgi:hypothetical protein